MKLPTLACAACALLAMPPTLRAQDAKEIERLKQQLEALKQENEALKHGKVQPKTLDPRGAHLVVDLGKGVKMEFIRIKAGEFLMGAPDSDKQAGNNEKPQHKVKLTQDYYLGKYPVTQEQYYAVMGKNPSAVTSDYFRHHESKVIDTRHYPVEHVTWDMATAFCGELRQFDKQQRKFSLPTEAEWEYAQRAGTTTIYSFGDDPTDITLYAWYSGNSGGKTHEVGTKKPNAWGLYDMEGNVWHWCADWYAADYYLRSPAVDPQGPDRGTLRVVRGNQYSSVRGSLPGSGALNSRSAARLGSNRAGSDTGFRVCLRVDPGKSDEAQLPKTINDKK